MKTIWIANHYANAAFHREGGRHYYFSKFLMKKGYTPIMFFAEKKKNISKSTSIKESTEGIKGISISAGSNSRDGIARLWSMYLFYRNLKRYFNNEIKKGNRPDVILVSSVHPLTLVAGIKIGKKHNIPIICEVRDLWPESIIAYSKFTKKNILIRILYRKERWIYEKANKLIFTMEGGKDYIVEKKWDSFNNGRIDISKIHHINNGIDLQLFNYNKDNFYINDDDLNSEKFKVIYTGSIRKANNVIKIINTAKYLQNIDKDIIFLIYGDGSQRQDLEQYLISENITNVIFKGKVEKKYIPYILSKSDLNIFHFKHNGVEKYGASLNKMFEYFASGKPLTTDCEFGYDLIKKYNAGVVVDNATEEEWAKEIVKIKELDAESYHELCNNSLKAAINYDFETLTNKLIQIIES